MSQGQEDAGYARGDPNGTPTSFRVDVLLLGAPTDADVATIANCISSVLTEAAMTRILAAGAVRVDSVLGVAPGS